MLSTELRNINRIKCASYSDKNNVPNEAILLNSIPMKAYSVLVDEFNKASMDDSITGDMLYTNLIDELINSINDEDANKDMLTYFAQIAFWIMDVKTVNKYINKSRVKVNYIYGDFGWSNYPTQNINDVIIELMSLLRDCYIIKEDKGFTAYSSVCNNFSNPLFSMSCSY